MYAVIEGDLEPDMNLTVTVNGVAEPLTGALAINLRWRKPDDTVVLSALSAVDLALGKVKKVWAVGDTDQVGVHYGQIAVTRSNGEIQSFPNDGSLIIWHVYPRVD